MLVSLMSKGSRVTCMHEFKIGLEVIYFTLSVAFRTDNLA